MRNIRLKIEYEGTNYCGWQAQRHRLACKNLPSIQETIEKTLRKILQDKINLVASGRTDAGVHALAQAANFKTRSDMELGKLQRALNGLLPEDICVAEVREAAADFHSRFHTKSKTYRYAILNRPYPSALLRKRVYFYPYPLDIKLMQSESRVLCGEHDFSSFKGSGSDTKDAVRSIKKIKVAQKGGFIYIDIEADGFLYNMVRSIAGTLIEIGRHRFKKGYLKRVILARNRKMAGPTLPSQGLCLVKVKY